MPFSRFGAYEGPVQTYGSLYGSGTVKRASMIFSYVGSRRYLGNLRVLAERATANFLRHADRKHRTSSGPIISTPRRAASRRIPGATLTIALHGLPGVRRSRWSQVAWCAPPGNQETGL